MPGTPRVKPMAVSVQQSRAEQAGGASSSLCLSFAAEPLHPRSKCTEEQLFLPELQQAIPRQGKQQSIVRSHVLCLHFPGAWLWFPLWFPTWLLSNSPAPGADTGICDTQRTRTACPGDLLEIVRKHLGSIGCEFNYLTLSYHCSLYFSPLMLISFKKNPSID